MKDNAVTHELVVRALANGTDAVSLRSHCQMPQLHQHHMAGLVQREYRLPADMSDTMIALMEMHGEALARDVGHSWLRRND